ncbi:MAG: hypothetical protein ACTSUQ_08805 [Candidatus Freyarchaeota archaeon]
METSRREETYSMRGHPGIHSLDAQLQSLYRENPSFEGDPWRRGKEDETLHVVAKRKLRMTGRRRSEGNRLRRT